MTDSSEKPGVFNGTFSSLPTTVFEAMSRLAAEHKSINLGQGFPDTELEGPDRMKDIVTRSLAEESNQYPPMMGLPQLRQAVAQHSERHGGMAVDWTSEVLITVGATEALAAAFLGLLNAGDEVVLFAPLYDSYVPMIRRAGAHPRVINLAPPSWNFTLQDLDDAFSARTKLVVLNTPHNPTGKVWTRDELESVAAAVRRTGAYAILDEVYQHLVFPGHDHVSLRSLPGMLDRCLRIGSAGKTFSFTDFKVGWLTGPKILVSAVAKAHQFLTFTVNSALQRAVAHGLEKEEAFYTG
jgi:aspartate/methionine/tyrosine aminotransferase